MHVAQGFAFTWQQRTGRFTERESVEIRNNLPQVVIHTLSSHGPVEVTTVGNGITARLPCAPFEDRVYLFVVPGSGTEAGLLLHAGLRISAKAEDGAYTIRMSGRAHAGLPLSGHRDRSALEAWAPEGIPQGRILVVPFAAEDLEYVVGAGDEMNRYSGRTPVGISRDSPARDYTRVAVSGMALPMVVWTTLLYLGWLIAQGVRFDGREIAAGLGLVGGLGLIMGLRLIYVTRAFVQWRRGQASIADAPVLSEGLLAPAQAHRAAAVLLGLSALSLISLAMLWGSELVGVVVGVTGVWLIAPAWALHLLIGRPEAPR